MVSLDMRKCEKFVTEFGESNTFFVFPPSIADLKIRMKTNDVTNEIKKDELQEFGNRALHEMQSALDDARVTKVIGYRIINQDLEVTVNLFFRFINILY